MPLGTHFAHIISAYPKHAADNPKQRQAAWLSGDRTQVNRERHLMPLPLGGQCKGQRFSFEVDISQFRNLHSDRIGHWGEENYPLALALVQYALCAPLPEANHSLLLHTTGELAALELRHAAPCSPPKKVWSARG